MGRRARVWLVATLVLLATVGSVLPALAAPGSLLLKAAVVESLVDDGTVRFWVGVFGPLVMPERYTLWIHLSGGLWAICFLVFCFVYLPILFKPRLDGKPG